MPRGLDHIVHAVRDLDAAAAVYGRLGFTVGARNRHPWGTHNRIVQLPGFFIELLTVAEPEKLGQDGFSQLFGRFNREFLDRHEGLSLLILESRDAAADAAQFRAAGIAASEVMRFEREGARPDGTIVKVAFSLAFARDAAAPNIGFATCQQHFPENFWNPIFQQHANTVEGVSGVVIVAENPGAHQQFMATFAGIRERTVTTSRGIAASTPRGNIQVLTPADYKACFGVDPPDTGPGARLAALRVAVRDFSAAVSVLQATTTDAMVRMGRIVVGPHAAMGAAIVFEPGDR